MFRLPVVANFVFFLTIIAVNAQVTSTTSSNDTRPAEIIRSEDAVNKLLLDSGILFREGLLSYEDNHLSDAGEKFNKSVEVFLYSPLSIQREQKLQGCYNPLIETIYRIEFPTYDQLPHVKNLVQTCNWNNLDKSLSIDDAWADKITHMVQGKVPKGTNKRLEDTTPGNPTLEVNRGFNTREFEPSPLDDLAKLELTRDEEIISDEHTSSSNIRVVKARAGDTVAKIALRYGEDATEIAKYNGLLPISVISAGREIKLPSNGNNSGIVYRPSSPCTLTPQSAPSLRGLRLGMTYKQVVALYGPIFSPLTASISRKKGIFVYATIPGIESFYYMARPGRKISQFDGIHSILILIYDDSVFRVALNYQDGDLLWKDSYEFASLLSEKLGLPKDSWVKGITGYENLKCNGFEMLATASRNAAAVYMTNTTVVREIERKRYQTLLNAELQKKEAELKKKRAFKP